MAGKEEQIRSVSVDTWHRLALEGSDIPISVFLSGESMRPLIRKQVDKVKILPLRRPVKRGDIVLFADTDGRYVVHRVWKRLGNRIVTLGDHCTRPDRPLDESRIWGLAIQVQRGDWKLSLDNKVARSIGCIWMFLVPLRRYYIRIKHRGDTYGTQGNAPQVSGTTPVPAGCPRDPGLPPVSGGTPLSGCQGQR